MADGKATRILGVLIQFLTFLVLVGILVVLAMLLVEFKKMTGNDYYWNINPINGQQVSVEFSRQGTNQYNPFYMSAVE